MALDVKYLKGSSEQYKAYLNAGKIVSTYFYYIDEKDLYLGTVKLSNQEDITNAILSLKLSETYATKDEFDTLSNIVESNSDKIEELRVEIENNSNENIEALVEKINSLESEMKTVVKEEDLIPYAKNTDIESITNDLNNIKDQLVWQTF